MNFMSRDWDDDRNQQSDCGNWRGLPWFLAVLFFCLTGCAGLKPDAIRAEWEHVSHPLAGPPFGPVTEEDSLNHLAVLLKWHQQRGWYAEIGVGCKLADGGMYGPDLTFVSRVGKEIRLTQ